jgi:hypothetical protein
MTKAAKKAATPKKPPKAKKPRKVKGAAADPSKPAPVVAGSNSIDRDMQNLARHHRDKYITAKSALSKAQRGMQALGKLVKADGLTMRQIKLMVELMTPEGEAAFRANVAADLVAAQWQGAEIGAQLQLFLEPDRTPSVDMAYEEGVQDAMDGKTAIPKYAPSVPQHQRYMDGFHAETERRVKAGIKSDVKPNPSRAEVLAAARGQNEVPSPPADKLN